MNTDKYREMEFSVLRTMFFHFIELLFTAGLSPNEVVSEPQTNLQRRHGGDGDHDNQYHCNATDPYAWGPYNQTNSYNATNPYNGTYPYNATNPYNGTYPCNATDPSAVADSAAQASADHASLVRRAVIGSVVGGVGLMLFLFLGFCFLRRRRRRRLAVMEKDGALIHRDSRESEEATSTEEHYVVTGKNMVRLVPPPGQGEWDCILNIDRYSLPAFYKSADEGPSGRRHDEPPPAYHG
ncbi:hypothetical protein IW262DRAFT_328932 [Armillaria fumosa]|nr:hypothetical protein IW262DRAFT_328932 [Armillaria fumosa]